MLPLDVLGYGFVDFESPADAAKAVHYLQRMGIMVQFAKLPLVSECVCVCVCVCVPNVVSGYLWLQAVASHRPIDLAMWLKPLDLEMC